MTKISLAWRGLTGPRRVYEKLHQTHLLDLVLALYLYPRLFCYPSCTIVFDPARLCGILISERNNRETRVMTATKTEPAPAHRDLDAKHKLREVWLDRAMVKVRRHFKARGYEVPDNVRVGAGWPSRGGLGKAKRTIGEAWNNECSADGSHEIIISVYLEDPVKVLGVLIHETIHVTVGVDKGHRKPFVDCMNAVGLCGKPTATDETEELIAELRTWLTSLGAYPHARLDGHKVKKQNTRLLKLECACGLKIRSTQKWLDAYGHEWPCPCGGTLACND